MRGEFIGVWSETVGDIWLPLAQRENVPADIFCELYRELTDALRVRPAIEELADIVDDPLQSRDAFERVNANELASEFMLVKFLESAYEVIDDVGGADLSLAYVGLLRRFIDKYSIRYDLRAPCKLCPTLSGIFASLMRELRQGAAADAHVGSLFSEFEEAVSDLWDDSSDRRIKTAIQKQINLLEALGASCPGVSARELGRICSEIDSWPHQAVRSALGSLYGFASDYPGIRHAGNPGSAIRSVDMRDMIAMAIILTGFTPYLRAPFNHDAVYAGR